MKYAIRVVTPAVGQALGLAEVKEHLRVTDPTGSEDLLLGAAIVVAQALAENETRRTLLPQTVDVLFPGFPTALGLLKLPCAPVRAVTSVSYYDDANVLQVVDPAVYEADLDSVRPYLVAASGQNWPNVYERIWPVEVRLEIGYAGAASIPEPIKQWMRCAVAAMFENRELVERGQDLKMAPFLAGLLDPYRIVEV